MKKYVVCGRKSCCNFSKTKWCSDACKSFHYRIKRLSQPGEWERKRAYEKQYRRRNPEIVAKMRQADYAKNSDAYKDRARSYRTENPEKVRDYLRNYVNLRRSSTNGIKFNPDDLKAKMAYWGNKCWMCGSSDVKLEADHVKPISKGGPHMLSNLRPACRTCNASKHAKWPGPGEINNLKIM